MKIRNGINKTNNPDVCTGSFTAKMSGLKPLILPY